MIFSRLKLARNLLRDDGLVFVSIDNSEVSNLETLCKEVFGERNYVGTVSRTTGTRMGSGSKGIARELDYLVIFSKSEVGSLNKLPMTNEEISLYDLEDNRGKYLIRSLRRTGGENRREDRPSMFFPVTSPEGDKIYPMAPEGWESRWVCGKESYEKLVADDLIVWKKMKKDGVESWKIYQKHYMDSGKEISDLWAIGEGNKKATKDLNSLFEGAKVFDHPKPIEFVRKIVSLATTAKGSDIVMDFFAGSGTTAHAVSEQNSIDGGNRIFILVQVPEAVDESSVAFKKGYKTISEICKERLRRSGAQIKSGSATTFPDLDVGFRVFKIDTSNLGEVMHAPDLVRQDSLFTSIDNIKSDRSAEDLLFQVLLNWGVDLTLALRKVTIQKHSVFFVDENALVACFDTGVTETLVKELAQHKPLRAVFRDNGFASDAVKINVEQIFKQLSPGTEVRSI
jgi:adenine-specific DNA-methyltransferase